MPIPTEFFENIQKGIGGIGPGLLQGALMQREQVQQQQELMATLATKGFVPVAQGETPEFSIGGRGYKTKPLSQLELTETLAKISKQIASIKDLEEKGAREIAKSQRSMAIKQLESLSKLTDGFVNIGEQDKKTVTDLYKILGMTPKFEPSGKKKGLFGWFGKEGQTLTGFGGDISLPATIKTTSEALAYLMDSHNMDADQARAWLLANK
jgi:hypothetical protein